MINEDAIIRNLWMAYQFDKGTMSRFIMLEAARIMFGEFNVEFDPPPMNYTCEPPPNKYYVYVLMLGGDIGDVGVYDTLESAHDALKSEIDNLNDCYMGCDWVYSNSIRNITHKALEHGPIEYGYMSDPDSTFTPIRAALKIRIITESEAKELQS